MSEKTNNENLVISEKFPSYKADISEINNPNPKIHVHFRSFGMGTRATFDLSFEGNRDGEPTGVNAINEYAYRSLTDEPEQAMLCQATRDILKQIYPQMSYLGVFSKIAPDKLMVIDNLSPDKPVIEGLEG